MIISLALLSFQAASAYNVMRASRYDVDQPDDSWFSTENSRARPVEFNSYQARYNPQKRFTRYFNNVRLTEEECAEVIMEGIEHGEYENQIEECAHLHRMIMNYLFDQ